MMRIGVVLFENMRYAPFLHFYEDLLRELEIEYDVIYLDRVADLNELKDEHHIAIRWHKSSNAFLKKYEKAYNFLKFAGRLRAILRREKYGYLIILTMMPAVLISGLLIKKYKNRYIVDIRDYTHEDFAPYFMREASIVQHSALNIISSPDFKNFLPEAEYLLCHNMNDKAEKILQFDHGFRRAEGRPIIISYVGSILYEKQCKKLIDLVLKDSRFEMRFYGNESRSQEVSDYVASLNRPEIRMMGGFLQSDKPGIFNQSDLIFNCYGNDIPLVQYAISNKHYDGALYRRPLLVSPCTTMESLAGKNAFAIDLDTVDNLDGLYAWYRDLNEDDYNRYAENILLDALRVNEATQNAVKAAILGEVQRQNLGDDLCDRPGMVKEDTI